MSLDPAGAVRGAVRTDSLGRALADLATGRPVVVLDAADRENEGDLVMAAQFATAESIGLFVRHGSGLLCAPMPVAHADRLGLPLMVERNEESLRTAYTVTVDAREGVHTGISAADRATTLQLLAAPMTRQIDLVRPGHVLPLRAVAGGVLARPGHTEATVDLLTLAGLTPVGVIVELVEDDGSMRRAPSCRDFCDEHGLALVTIAELAAHLRRLGAPMRAAAPAVPGGVQRVATTRMPTRAGTFTAHGYRDGTGTEHVALVLGDLAGDEPVLTRVHSECLTGDALGSMRCDCGPQLAAAMRAVAERGRGVVVYLRGHEGRGIGLVAKLAAYALQDVGRDTVDANLDLGLPIDARDYAVAAAVLADLGVSSVELLTNNPAKVDALQRLGIRVTGQVPVLIEPQAHNVGYLRTKAERMGHRLPQVPVNDHGGAAL